MLKYIDKKDYINLLGVESIPNNFNELATRASNEIKKQTFSRVDEENVSEQVKFATCLVTKCLAEADEKKSNIGNLKSQNIEGWSETFVTAEEIEMNLETDIANILRTYLSQEVGIDGNLLLYRGNC